MNYKSQSRAFALDRALELHKGQGADVAQIIRTAEEILAYTYEAHEDMVDTAKYLYDLIRNAPAGKSGIDEIRMSLEAIEAERIQHGIDDKVHNA